MAADEAANEAADVAADAAADAARAAGHVAWALDAEEVWETFDPCGLLEQLICVGEVK